MFLFAEKTIATKDLMYLDFIGGSLSTKYTCRILLKPHQEHYYNLATHSAAIPPHLFVSKD